MPGQFEFVSTAAEAPTLRFTGGSADPFFDHVTAWLARIWRTRVVDASIEGRAFGPPCVSISYGDAPTAGESADVVIPRGGFTASNPPPFLDDFRGIDVAALGGRFPFDLFEAIRFWLTDAAHADARDEERDIHGRVTFAGSHFARSGREMAEPVVNRYVILLSRMVEHAVGRPMPAIWPGNKKACVILSHDVDAPLDEGAASSAFHSAAARLRVGQWGGAGYLLMSAAWQRMRMFARGRVRAVPHWNFERIVQDEGAFGFASTYFFASRHRWDDGAHPGRDVNYDIGLEPFHQVFDHLRRHGSEVALHASYNAIIGEGTFHEELLRLRRESGSEVTGNRHHFWRLGRDLLTGLRIHESAGLHYDSSIAFNEGLGWRLGVGLPHYPWDAPNGRAIEVLQIPPMLMDGALWYQPVGMERALEKVDRLLDMLVEHQAVGSIDWHVCTSHPANTDYREWGLCYQAILKRLASRSDIWVATCDEVRRYWESRGV